MCLHSEEFGCCHSVARGTQKSASSPETRLPSLDVDLQFLYGSHRSDHGERRTSAPRRPPLAPHHLPPAAPRAPAQLCSPLTRLMLTANTSQHQTLNLEKINVFSCSLPHHLFTPQHEMQNISCPCSAPKATLSKSQSRSTQEALLHMPTRAPPPMHAPPPRPHASAHTGPRGCRACTHPCIAPCSGAFCSSCLAPQHRPRPPLTGHCTKRHPAPASSPHNACCHATHPLPWFSVCPHSPREWGTSQPSSGLHHQCPEHREAPGEAYGKNSWISPESRNNRKDLELRVTPAVSAEMANTICPFGI